MDDGAIPFLLEQVLANFMAKNKEGVLDFFADDVKLEDAEYAEPVAEGKAAMGGVLDLAFELLAQPRFSVRNVFLHHQIGVLQVDSCHRLSNGTEVNFPQVFVVETRDGLIVKLQSYVSAR